MPLRNHRFAGQFALLPRKKKVFLVPLTEDIIVKRGKAEFLGVKENFYGVKQPPFPRGWKLSFQKADVDKKASITIDQLSRKASVKLDHEIFDDPNVPEGCKVFIIWHEIGHLIFGPAEELCDEFAFWNALHAGVSPFLCYVAIRAYMPEHYDYRIERLGRLLLKYPQLKSDVTEGYGFAELSKMYKGYEIVLTPFQPERMRTPAGEIPYQVSVYDHRGNYAMATKGPAGNKHEALETGMRMVESSIKMQHR